MKDPYFSILNNGVYDCNESRDEISVMYQLNFETMRWTTQTTKIQHFGSLAIMNGIKYFINISNKERNLGYFYNARKKLWTQLTKPQMDLNYTYENQEFMRQTEEPLVLVPYYKPL